MCTDTPQRYLRRILVSDFKQTKRWPIIPSLRRCQCSPPPAYLSMCTDTPQRYLRRILILDFKQKNAGRPFSFQNRFSLLWQPCYRTMCCRVVMGTFQPSYISTTRWVEHLLSLRVCVDIFFAYYPAKCLLDITPNTEKETSPTRTNTNHGCWDLY